MGWMKQSGIHLGFQLRETLELGRGRAEGSPNQGSQSEQGAMKKFPFAYPYRV